MDLHSPISRRQLIAASGLTLVSSFAMPAIVRASARPTFTHGVQSGDVDATSAMVWTRVDRPARVLVEYDTTGRFADPSRLAPLDALPESDFAIKRLLDDLPPAQDIFFRFVAEDLYSPNARSEPVVGRFRTAPASRRDIRFAWSGDTAGQGFGIDAIGMRTSHHYDPSRAGFQDFDPFWEFVAGPLHAGSFAQKALDPTFGPQAVFVAAPPRPNVSPAEGYQFFGQVEIDGSTHELTVHLRDLDGHIVNTQRLPAPGSRHR